MNHYKIENKLKKYRLKARLSQFEVAQKMGFHSTDRISKWEQGWKMPNLKNLLKLAELYKVHPNELYTISMLM